MDWIQVFTIIGTIVGFLIWHANRVDTEASRQAARTDELYKMFVDLLKNNKKV